jgi:hypothetical protein
MNTEMHKRALAARQAHLALLDLKKVVEVALGKSELTSAACVRKANFLEEVGGQTGQCKRVSR